MTLNHILMFTTMLAMLNSEIHSMSNDAKNEITENITTRTSKQKTIDYLRQVGDQMIQNSQPLDNANIDWCSRMECNLGVLMRLCADECERNNEQELQLEKFESKIKHQKTKIKKVSQYIDEQNTKIEQHDDEIDQQYKKMKNQTKKLDELTERFNNKRKRSRKKYYNKYNNSYNKPPLHFMEHGQFNTRYPNHYIKNYYPNKHRNSYYDYNGKYFKGQTRYSNDYCKK